MASEFRIAIICGSLAQAGSERYVYELCRAIDRMRFAVDVLTIAPWGVGRHFYAQPIRLCGSRIRPILPLLYFRRFPKLLRTPALAAQAAYRRFVLPRILAAYDLLSIVHLDCLCDVEFMLPPGSPVVVHLTTHLCQYDYDYYDTWPRGRRAYVICMDELQAREAAAGLGSLIIDKMVAPLPMDPSGFVPITSSRHPQRLVVGCFMRIERDRQPLPVLRAFAELTKQTKAEMIFYGKGDASHLRAETERLGIVDRVRFPGHTRDIRRAVVDDGITFAWLTAVDGFIGYAGIELGLLGVPTYFYNVGSGQGLEAILRQTNGAIHCFGSERELAERTFAAWQCPSRLYADARRLRAFVEGLNDSKHVVREIETFYEQAIHRAKAHQTGDVETPPSSGRQHAQATFRSRGRC
jgi:glycosyltransferase involved in cell wall biosynthesis